MRRYIIGLGMAVMLMALGAPMGFAQGSEEGLLDLSCTRTEGVSCSERCGTPVINRFMSGGLEIVEVGTRSEISMIAGKTQRFEALCQEGFAAIGGGYRIIANGTTINQNELFVVENYASNNRSTNKSSWVTSVHRADSGAVNNCIRLEVRAMCARAVWSAP